MTPIGELERLAGKLLVVGFEGVEAPPTLLERIARGVVSGVVLFSRNVESLEQVTALTDRLARAAPAEAPLIVAVDQEGGRVQRLREPRVPLAQLPAARAVAARQSTKLTREVGHAVGQDLFLLGFNLDFAPVLDVVTSDENSIIGDRSFGPEPESVARHALSFARGLRESGVLPCGKHFPGHGGPVGDSHKTLPRDPRSRPEIEALDLVPFSAAAERRVPMLMSAHVVFPAFDDRAPATLSRSLSTDLLRGVLGFEGVLISDDMEMDAIALHHDPGEAALEAVRAGVDQVLFCHREDRQASALEALARAAGSSARDRERLEEAGRRVDELRQLLSGPREESLEARVAHARQTGEHAELLASLARAVDLR
jgi:beta-N-acetylhexosaminidase